MKKKGLMIKLLDALVIIIFNTLLVFLLTNSFLNEKKEFEFLIINVLTFSSLFSAILIAHITSSVFQIRSEKGKRKTKIIDLSNKATHFRRICGVLKSSEIWEKTQLEKLKKVYKNLFFHHFQFSNEKKNPEIHELVATIFNEKNTNNVSESIGRLYIGLKTIALDDSLNLFQKANLMQDYDYDIEYPYEIVNIWAGANCATVLWYWLIDKWVFTKNHVSFEKLSEDEKEQILQLILKINKEKYLNKEFSRDLLGKIGTDFNEYYFPKLRELTYLNSLSPPKELTFLVNVLLVIISTGVFIPLILSSIRVENTDVFFVLMSLSIFSIVNSLFITILYFKRILFKEMLV